MQWSTQDFLRVTFSVHDPNIPIDNTALRGTQNIVIHPINLSKSQTLTQIYTNLTCLPLRVQGFLSIKHLFVFCFKPICPECFSLNSCEMEFQTSAVKLQSPCKISTSPGLPKKTSPTMVTLFAWMIFVVLKTNNTIPKREEHIISIILACQIKKAMIVEVQDFNFFSGNGAAWRRFLGNPFEVRAGIELMNPTNLGSQHFAA